MFAGYDLFREGKVRRFWARQPASLWRPLLLGRLYPYLERSPVSQRAMTRQFFGQNLAAWRSPGFGHDMRWRGTGALRRLFSADLRNNVTGRDVVRELIDGLPQDFPRWSPLAQDQFIEIRTLLSGYLLSSQGDRMLMANSVEGRFPFLDLELARLADSLPPSYKLHVLDEKHVLKRVGLDTIPREILERKKQPYRAPDAMAFAGSAKPAWVSEVTSDRALADAGVFNSAGARQVLDKCLSRGAAGQFSNADNMAVVGILSTQLVHDILIRRAPRANFLPVLATLVDRLAPVGAVEA